MSKLNRNFSISSAVAVTAVVATVGGFSVLYSGNSLLEAEVLKAEAEAEVLKIEAKKLKEEAKILKVEAKILKVEAKTLERTTDKLMNADDFAELKNLSRFEKIMIKQHRLSLTFNLRYNAVCPDKTDNPYKIVRSVRGPELDQNEVDELSFFNRLNELNVLLSEIPHDYNRQGLHAIYYPVNEDNHKAVFLTQGILGEKITSQMMERVKENPNVVDEGKAIIFTGSYTDGYDMRVVPFDIKKEELIIPPEDGQGFPVRFQTNGLGACSPS